MAKEKTAPAPKAAEETAPSKEPEAPALETVLAQVRETPWFQGEIAQARKPLEERLAALEKETKRLKALEAIAELPEDQRGELADLVTEWHDHFIERGVPQEVLADAKTPRDIRLAARAYLAAAAGKRASGTGAEGLDPAKLAEAIVKASAEIKRPAGGAAEEPTLRLGPAAGPSEVTKPAFDPKGRHVRELMAWTERAKDAGIQKLRTG